MLHIKIVCVGKIKESYWNLAIEEYLKRLHSYANVNIVEIPDIDPERVGGIKNAIKIECEKIANYVNNQQSCFVILLDIQGKLLSSQDLASKIENISLEGINNIIFIVGGSFGINNNIKSLSKLIVSFGKITLPHNLARVVLVEQLYRAFKIIRKEPYHK